MVSFNSHCQNSKAHFCGLKPPVSKAVALGGSRAESRSALRSHLLLQQQYLQLSLFLTISSLAGSPAFLPQGPPISPSFSLPKGFPHPRALAPLLCPFCLNQLALCISQMPGTLPCRHGWVLNVLDQLLPAVLLSGAVRQAGAHSDFCSDPA